MSKHSEHKEHAFDAFCKRILKNEVTDAHREDKRQRQREISFSQLDQGELTQLTYLDRYAPDRQDFCVLGMTMEVLDGGLVQALNSLSNDRQAIVLLAYLLELSDLEIAARLGLPRSTVQYRRASALQQMKKMLEGYEYE